MTVDKISLIYYKLWYANQLQIIDKDSSQIYGKIWRKKRSVNKNFQIKCSCLAEYNILE